jgi:hypothetical protein
MQGIWELQNECIAKCRKCANESMKQTFGCTNCIYKSARMLSLHLSGKDKEGGFKPFEDNFRSKF